MSTLFLILTLPFYLILYHFSATFPLNCPTHYPNLLHIRIQLRCLCLRPVHHHHLRQCRPGSDRKPDASLPVCLPAELHGARLPVHHAVHHRATRLHGQPSDCHVRAQIFPVEGRSAQRLLGSVHSGRLERDGRVLWASVSACCQLKPCILLLSGSFFCACFTFNLPYEIDLLSFFLAEKQPV